MPKSPPASPKVRRVSIVSVLTIGLVAFVFIAVLSVSLVTLYTARRNTFDLLRDKSVLYVQLIEERVRNLLDPAQAQTDYIAQLIRQKDIEPNDLKTLRPYLAASMASAPQLQGAIYFSADGKILRALRTEQQIATVTEETPNEAEFVQLFEEAEERKNGYWGEPIWGNLIGDTLVNFRRPIFLDGKLVGLAGAAVLVRQLSKYLVELEPEASQNPFILYGRDHVMAHANLIKGFTPKEGESALPTMSEIGDPVLQAFWSPEAKFTDTEGQDNTKQTNYAHLVTIKDQQYVIIYKYLYGYGDVPLIVGTYARAELLAAQLDRIDHTIYVGIAILLIAAGLTYLLGRSLSRPIQALANEAKHIGNFDFQDIKLLKPSMLKEINDAVTAFNTMVVGLKAFETYVPRTLVNRLMRSGAGVRSETRNITIMFTDLVGFTSFAEKLDAQATADYINDHFANVTKIIEKYGGTVDKFLGDAVMAFWGAPEDEPEHALKACQAALEIAAWQHRHIQESEQRHRTYCRLRIGIHTGPATIGNIGAPTRMNYTVIGDSVNSAKRLESLGKKIAPKDEVVILVSQATLSQLPSHNFTATPVGEYQLRGRSKAIRIYRLDSELPKMDIALEKTASSTEYSFLS